MSNLIVLEIEKNLMTPCIEYKLKESSKFYDTFDGKIITILFESLMPEILVAYLVEHKNIVEICKLNQIARNRLMTNFESERPELTLILMGCGKDSKLIKVQEKNVNREK